MKGLRWLLVGVSALAFAQCPYTEGCENLASSDEGGVPDFDADTDVDASIPLGPLLPTCQGLVAQCNGESCCASSNVPGGTFNRINDPTFPAQVAPFRLDNYEVVIGRFRAFINAGFGTKANPPAVGAGAHPNIPNSGWKPEYGDVLNDDTFGFRDAVKCDPELYKAFDDTPGVNDTLPMNCVTWAEAFAFCIWDGGWLPTETEWNYAAAGGGEQRIYPWNDVIDPTRASYGCQSGDSIADPGAPLCTFADYKPVGTHPNGKGRWGHYDLSGNVWERVLDFYHDPLALPTCDNCFDPGPSDLGHPIRGGSINWAVSYLRSNDRGAVNSETAETRTNTVGFRCARPVK